MAKKPLTWRVGDNIVLSLQKMKSQVFSGLFVALILTGCASDDNEMVIPKTNFSEYGVNRPDAPSGSQSDSQTLGQGDDQQNARPQYISGTGQFVRQVNPLRQITPDPAGGVSLTFKNTDIRIILRAVLGDTLGIAYQVDSRVQGVATLETSGGISKEALREALESLLRTKGYALVAASDGYHVLPVADAPRSIDKIAVDGPASSNLPGFGVHVVTLKHTIPTEIQTLIEPFAPPGGILKADDGRNILILAGTNQEVSGMLRAIETFDVDRMAGMSYAIYPLKYVEADKLVDELKAVFSAPDNKQVQSVHLIPVPRINRVIAVAPQKEQLFMVERWINKLDLGESSPGRRIYVYQVKNGRAADIAGTLNLILGVQYNQGYGNSQTSYAGQQQQYRYSSTSGRSSSFGQQQGLQRGGSQGGNQDSIRIVPSEENNSLVIMATPSEFGVVETALKKIDTPPRQVLVEVTLAEITLTDELRHGLQWHFEFGGNSVSFGSSASPTSEFPGFSWNHVSSNSASAVLNALESMTDVKVISSPKILALNNQPAFLQVGDEVPVPTSSAVSTGDSNAPIVNTIQYRSTGIILTVTPRINEGGLVMLDVEQQISSVVETTSSGIDAPTIQQRQMNSAVAIQDGSTVVLGGLIRSSISKNNSGVPILKDIPLLGHAFKNSNFVERRSELIVFLTPRIIRDADEAASAMDDLQRQFRFLMEDTEAAKKADPEKK